MKLGPLKYLLRSRSLKFFLDHRAKFAPGVLSSYSWQGCTLWYRPGTSDTGLIYSILLKQGRKGEYAIPPEMVRKLGEVGTVLDVGANIGVSTVFLACTFPGARIFAFEPVPDNHALLCRNVSSFPQVRALQVALGERDGSIDILHSDDPANFGGFSRFAAGTDAGRSVSVPLRNASNQLSELGVQAADVIKIDTEGSEWDVLTTLGRSYLKRTRLIIGELHGRRDFELLAFLDDDFRIEVRKRLHDRLFMFRALNRAL